MTSAIVAGLREKSPPVSANGSVVDTPQAASTLVDALHGEQRAEDLLRQRRASRRAGRSTSVGAQNQPSPATPSARAAIVPVALGELGVAAHPLLRLLLDHRRDVVAERLGLAHLQDVDRA